MSKGSGGSISLKPGEETTIRNKDSGQTLKVRKSSDGVYQAWLPGQMGSGWKNLPQSVESIERQIAKYSK